MFPEIATRTNVDLHGSGSATLPGASVAASAEPPPYPSRPAQEISLQTLVPNFQIRLEDRKKAELTNRTMFGNGLACSIFFIKNVKK
jgi:hypothetical protein